MTVIEKFENEKESLKYHLKSINERLLEDSEDILAKEQLEKVNSYIRAIDKQIEVLKKETES